jgi:cytoskeletal protein CcmA (bactofilin family)
VKAGETHSGDLYLFKQSVNIAGTQEGDLVAFANSLKIAGEVTGDVVFFGQTFLLTGTIGDSARIWAQDITVEGTIDGDLIAGGATVLIASGGHVTGSVNAYGGEVTVDGTIDGALSATSGQVSIRGHIGKDAAIRCDQLQLDPEARIGGNLSYESRRPLELQGKGTVAGRVDFLPKLVKENESLFSAGRVFWHLFLLVGSFLLGVVALALFGRPSQRIIETVGTDTLRSAGIGFLTIVVVPTAAVFSCILIVTIPLAIIVILLWLIAVLLLAKLPVVVWAGRWILRRLGRPAPSTYGSLALGLVLFYLVFQIPYIGWIVWLVCVFLGLGAIVIGVRAGYMSRRHVEGALEAPGSPVMGGQAAPGPTSGSPTTFGSPP